MKIGVMTYREKPTIPQIDWIGKNKFGFVDLSMEPPCATAEAMDPKKIRLLLKKYDLGMTGHTSPHLPFTHLHKEIRDAASKELKKYLVFLHKVGSPNMNIHSPFKDRIDPRKAIEHYSELLDVVMPLARKYKIKVMLENWLNTDEYIRFYRGIFKRYPKLKLHLDIGHCYLRPKKDMVSWFLKNYGDRIEHVHFSDNLGRKDNHYALGEGAVPWLKTIRLLKKYGYDGTITLETFFMRGKRRQNAFLYSRNKLLKWWGNC
ncbi:MAG: sugar phosphate isomerase/epimerase [Nanoarchaeota archaeon]|nr:sugar phosphate isomerase/epimerase [Nanoarchaeota archaeon]